MFEQPHRLHPAAIIINFGSYLVKTIKTLFPPIIALVASGGRSGVHNVALYLGLSVAGIGGIAFFASIFHFLSTRFWVESESLVITSGFIWRKRRTMPLARIQNVNVERTIWHRLLGAAQVKVENASGHQGEGGLDALSVTEANQLQALLLHHRATVETGEAPIVQPIYALSLKQVMLAGMLENRVTYILAGIFTTLQFDKSETVISPLVAASQKLGPTMSIVVGVLAFAALIVIGWIVSIVISATRFYGFRIDKHDRGLMLTHGLLTQFKAVVPVGRIQSVRINQPILFRLLGYCEMFADTAGSFDKKDQATANKICPILPEHDVSTVGCHLMPHFEYETLQWRRVSQKTVWRHAFRYFILCSVIICGALSIRLHWHALWMTVPIAVGAAAVGWMAFRFVGYAFTDNNLAARRGIFRKQAILIPFDRIQHYAITSTYFQRAMGLANITAVSASTGGHAIHIADLDATTAAELSNAIGQAVRGHLGSRRGGL